MTAGLVVKKDERYKVFRIFNRQRKEIKFRIECETSCTEIGEDDRLNFLDMPIIRLKNDTLLTN